MAHDPKHPDDEHVDVHNPERLRGWSRTLGVPPARVKEAVEAVGDRAGSVREYLDRKPGAGTQGGGGDRFSERRRG